MDVLLPTVLAVLALFGIVASIAGVESREGFDRDGHDSHIDAPSH